MCPFRSRFVRLPQIRSYAHRPQIEGAAGTQCLTEQLSRPRGALASVRSPQLCQISAHPWQKSIVLSGTLRAVNGGGLMRFFHILTHPFPLQSAYVYDRLEFINQQRFLGWDPFLLTRGKNYAQGPPREQRGGWKSLRTPMPT